MMLAPMLLNTNTQMMLSVDADVAGPRTPL